MGSKSESTAHRELKRLARVWAAEHAFVIASEEVRVPRSSYRADVAACARRGGPTAVFECKCSRPDFLRDAYDWSATRERVMALATRRAQLEAMLSVHCPDLRRGDSLFPEFDSWDFERLEHQTYREVLLELSRLQERTRDGTKFSRMFRYRCADVLYLVMEDDLHAPSEAPAGWGVLVRKQEELVLVRPPVAQITSAAQRRDLLEAVALAATKVRGPGATFASTRS